MAAEVVGESSEDDETLAYVRRAPTSRRRDGQDSSFVLEYAAGQAVAWRFESETSIFTLPAL